MGVSINIYHQYLSHVDAPIKAFHRPKIHIEITSPRKGDRNVVQISDDILRL